MKHLVKAAPDSEQTEFNKKFDNKKKSYRVSFDMLGNILAIHTEDKEIIAYAKTLGLK